MLYTIIVPLLSVFKEFVLQSVGAASYKGTTSRLLHGNTKGCLYAQNVFKLQKIWRVHWQTWEIAFFRVDDDDDDDDGAFSCNQSSSSRPHE